MRKATLLSTLLLAAAAALPAALHASPEVPASVTADPAMAKVLADPRRDKDRARDAFRHPAETLAFFRIKPGMTVADYMPSSGWYTRILVPYLGDEGTYIGITASPANASGDTKIRLEAFPGSFPASLQAARARAKSVGWVLTTTVVRAQGRERRVATSRSVRAGRMVERVCVEARVVRARRARVARGRVRPWAAALAASLHRAMAWHTLAAHLAWRRVGWGGGIC
jgi:hypothetical protein